MQQNVKSSRLRALSKTVEVVMKGIWETDGCIGDIGYIAG